ncbi:hypothetical protein DIPPA_00123 [Diplonema papillatum]|nr:hypothetical protein DIPPA_00123 [Diplonema papillatum]
MRSFKIFGIVVFMAVAMFAAADENNEEEAYVPPTEAEVRKMKIKQLKQFLEDRGLLCKDCFEKNDFQKFVLANREVKLLASKRPRKVKKEPLDTAWKKMALEVCEEVKAPEAQCKPFTKVVTGSFDMHGRKVSKQMHREVTLITKTSMGVPYAEAMSFLFRETLKWMVKNDITTQDAVREKLDTRIKMFVTECASDNPNPSYEFLEKAKKGKVVIDEL